ncbi:hypothetical protein K491DRAFT_252991 [Lophiostoma macrostomum CBS 122681]|uniref:Uncharacterized protein n=1 Tax=Lophiostoma macrostomum CBS 122681 TaxID=1314788 RepID=A0A6A6TIA3_9PLEO|nr:hypothetical protein K491DRAFT_252991 [Lophiostoma macrostomum CBS 122681]
MQRLRDHCGSCSLSFPLGNLSSVLICQGLSYHLTYLSKIILPSSSTSLRIQNPPTSSPLPTNLLNNPSPLIPLTQAHQPSPLAVSAPSYVPLGKGFRILVPRRVRAESETRAPPLASVIDLGTSASIDHGSCMG